MQSWSDEFITIRPDGIIYVPALAISQRLTEAFGPGGWALEEIGDLKHDGGELMIQPWRLFCKGYFVSQTMGECAWKSSNRMMSRGDAVEGCKSNALARNTKNLVNQTYRTPRFAYRFKLDYGVKVKIRGGKGEGWRHYDDPPLDREYDICDDSPNRDKWRKPEAEHRAAGQTTQREPEPPQQQGLVVTSSEVIGHSAIKQIAVAMKEHNRKEGEVKAHLKAKYNIVSRKQIQRRWFNDILAWIQGAESKAITPEVLGPEPDVSAEELGRVFDD